jgi:small multidrug resistance family-3 protein
MIRALSMFIAAAAFEIAGCFAVFAVVRQGASWPWLVAGFGALAVFAWLLTLVDLPRAGRAYAIYGGIYIAASLAWLWGIEGDTPDLWDMTGALISVLGAFVILLGPRP